MRAFARQMAAGRAMKPLGRTAVWLLAVAILAGCASTEVTQRKTYQGAKLPRPDRIIVYDFTGNPADVPPESPFAAQIASGSVTPTPEQREVSRKLGAEIAQNLVTDLKDMGLPAVRAEGQPPPKVDDIVLRGYFISVDQGSAEKRLLIGFGSGEAELKAAVEGYHMTPQGLRLLGSGEVSSGGNKLPGVAVPAAVLAATANPIGLVVGGAAKLYGEASGSATIEGTGERTAAEIAAQLRETAEKQGWI